jgi:hypothetical protein
MKKKPVYSVELFRENLKMQMNLEYHYDTKKGWVITYDGLELGSSWGRLVKVRDSLAAAISQNILNYWEENLVEKFCNIHIIPSRRVEFTHNADDEIWFAGGASAFSKGVNSGDLNIGKIKVPTWIHPADSVSSMGCPLHAYMALKRFLMSPVQRKNLRTLQIAKSFGI